MYTGFIGTIAYRWANIKVKNWVCFSNQQQE